jgi:carbon-monoxide dehydrogenase medium subunit
VEAEMLVRADLPIPEAWGFAELARRHGDFGLVTVVTVLVEGEWRVAIGGIAGVPFRPEECEALLNAGPANAERAREAARAAGAAIRSSDDLHASADYRRAMTEEFTFRSISQAMTNERQR